MLQRNNGNVADASEALGMPKKTLYHKLRNLRIPRAATRRPMAANDANEDTHSSMDRIDITEHGRVTGHLIRGVTHAQKTFRPSATGPPRASSRCSSANGGPAIRARCRGSRCPSSTATSNACSCRTNCAPCADAFDFAMQFATDNDLLLSDRARAGGVDARVAARLFPFSKHAMCRCAGRRTSLSGLSGVSINRQMIESIDTRPFRQGFRPSHQ